MHRIVSLLRKVFARHLFSPVQNNLQELARILGIQLLLPLMWLAVPAPEMSVQARLFHCLNLFALCVVITYVYALVRHCLTPSSLRPCLRRGFLFLLVLCQLVNIGCMVFMNDVFQEDTVAIVASTNPDESAEFFHAYFNVHTLLDIVVILLVAGVCDYYGRRLIQRHTPRRMPVLLLTGILLVSMADCCLVTDKYVPQTTVYGIVRTLVNYRPVKAIRATNPQLDRSKQEPLPLIAVIIGESLSKDHCSLYGYDKETNPALGAMPDSLLHIFTSAESPATHTIQSFSCFMTLADSIRIPQCYQQPNLVEIARLCGYHTAWISNQSEKGIYDNGVSVFAHLCDTTLWNGNRFAGINRNAFDGDLLPMIHDFPVSHRQWLFIHLMGNHEDCKKRYPATFARYSEADYPAAASYQRETLAHYDNSVYYNDSVVSGIIHTFRERDALILYFSDHALDIFGTSPTYCGHAKDADPRSNRLGKQIPFLIYTSEQFRTRHPEQTRMIERAVNGPLNTADLPYLMMQLMQVTFSDRANRFPL